MKELLEAAFAWINIIPTALLVFVLIYWLVVMAGLIDMHAIDIDADVHSDIPSKEIHTGVQADHADSVSWLNAVLAFFNLGQVPFMVFLSFLVLPMWVISVLANHYLGNHSLIIALALLLPNFIVSLFISKILTAPFVKVFSYLYQDPEAQQVIGKVCTVLLPASSDKMGQAVIRSKGNTLMLNVKTANGLQLEKGKNALVVEFQKDKKCYLIEKIEP